MGGGKPKAENCQREVLPKSSGQYHQRRREQNREARERILTTTDVLPDGTIRTQVRNVLLVNFMILIIQRRCRKQFLNSGQMGNPAPAPSTPAPVTATPKTPAAPAPAITEQPKEKGKFT